MLNSVYSKMAEALEDEVFEITDKNFVKVTENLGKVNSTFVCYCSVRQ